MNWAMLRRFRFQLSAALAIVRDRGKRAERQLRESEARYRALSDLSADSYWEQDEQHRFTMILPGRSSVVQHQSMLGKTRWEMPHAGMTDEDWRMHREVLDRHEAFHDLILKRLDAEGRLVYINVSGHPVLDGSGAFKGYRGVAKDVTLEKRGEQLLALEHTVTRRLSEASSTSAGLKAVMQAVCESLGWECGRYFSVDKEAGLLRFADFWSVPGEELERFIAASRDITFTPGASLAGRAWQSGEPLWSRDFSKDPRAPLQSAARVTGIRGAFVPPVLSEGKVIGVFTFNSREVREPDERLLQATRVISSQVGQFLRRKQAEEVLRKSEERFRSLTNLSSDMYWEQDEQYRFTSFSHSGPGWNNVSGPGRLGRTRWEQSYLNMTSTDWQAHIALLDARQPFHDLELCRLGERGEAVWVGVSGEPVFDEAGTFKGYRGVGKDITARKRAETVLRLEHTVTRCLAEANEASPAIQNVIHAVCETWNWECGRYFRVDEGAGVLRFADTWSVPDAEVQRYVELWRDVSYVPGVGLAGRAWQSKEPQWAADITSDPRVSRRAIAGESGMRGAFVFPTTAEGKVIGVFAFNSREVREPDERLLIATKVIGSQIGQFLQRKYAEEALRKGNERFNLAVRATNDVIWDWDLASDALWWNENITVFGYQREDIEPTGKSWHERIHPEDRARVVTGMHERIASGDESWSDEYRFQRKDAGYAFVFDRGHVIRDQAGAAVRMIGAMADITVRKQAEERLAYLAQFDSLTGLPNRHLFRDRLAHSMAQARRSGKSMAVLFIDLDRFKLVNDTLGHGAGDRLLKETTARLQGCVRSADTAGRFGGDEFGAILSELAKPSDASLVARKIIDSLARPFELDGHEIYVTASIGIALFPADSEDAATLITNADVAMYRAKEQGRNNYQYFTREMNERAQQRAQIETALRRAVERSEFLLHYQPKLEVGSGVLCGFEALLRWQHPERGLVSPVEFIPVLEETGLIVPVGEWVMREACAQIKAWRKAKFSVPPIAINLSARQFQQKDLESTVRRILRDTGVDPSLIQFELTESLLMKDPEAAARTLGGLKESSVKISVDDFGTGYSSLAYLKRFPLDALKIDRAFIRDITVDPDSAAITIAIIGLAHSLKLKVIAEGVETQSQLEFLAAHACDEVQGFFFSKAVAPEACERMLREGSVRGLASTGAASPVLGRSPRRPTRAA